MTTRDTETLADLINARAGKRSGKPLSFDDLSDLCIDPDTRYKPSGSYLWKIAQGEDVKVNQSLIRALTAGLGLPAARVEAAAHRQYIGPYAVVDPGLGGGGADDEVIRVATRRGVTPASTREVEGFVRRSRREDPPEQG